MIHTWVVTAGFVGIVFVLGMGLACAIDDDLVIGWDDTKPALRPLLAVVYLIVALYGVILLSKKAVPTKWPNWALYVRVVWLGHNYPVTTRGLELALEYARYHRRKPTRQPQWTRNLVARIMWLNRDKWPKTKAQGPPDSFFLSS